ncbi:MAG TPA: substrate-binding domain-containing protein [Pricia sp.]|nr:substrate-binding domain-containing protein [Pricia sp.]
MNKKTSLKDIAKKAGVSTATVSYVLSKKENSGISKQVSQKIRKIAKELHYRPNQIAKSLQSGKTFTLGLIVADISNPFFAHIARIIEDEAKKHRYSVIFGSSDENAAKSRDLIRLLANRQVDGFIIAPTKDSQKEIQLLKKQNIPFVLIDRHFPKIDTDYVGIDNHKAAYNATSRLIGTGNSKIGIIAYSTSLHHMQERIRGYRSALKEHDIAGEDTWIGKVDFLNVKEEVRGAMDRLLRGPQAVTAILFATNTLAAHGLKYIKESGIQVPEDLSVIAFDESDAFDFFYCPVTYVKQPLTKMGREAVKILTGRIADPEKPAQQLILDAKVIVRKSCETSATRLPIS